MAVESGWQGFEEVNRVWFDHDRVTVEQMIDWLKQSGTFVRFLEVTKPQAHPPEQKTGRPEKQVEDAEALL